MIHETKDVIVVGGINGRKEIYFFELTAFSVRTSDSEDIDGQQRAIRGIT